MMYREIIAVCYQIHTKHINILCGAERGIFLVLNLVVLEVTLVSKTAKYASKN